MCREVLRACRALLSEWNLSPMDWPRITERMQSVLNHAPLTKLGLRDLNAKGVYRILLEVFTGHRPVRPLLRAMPISDYPSAIACDELLDRQLIGFATLQRAAESAHREVHIRLLQTSYVFA